MRYVAKVTYQEPPPVLPVVLVNPNLLRSRETPSLTTIRVSVLSYCTLPSSTHLLHCEIPVCCLTVLRLSADTPRNVRSCSVVCKYNQFTFPPVSTPGCLLASRYQTVTGCCLGRNIQLELQQSSDITLINILPLLRSEVTLNISIFGGRAVMKTTVAGVILKYLCSTKHF